MRVCANLRPLGLFSGTLAELCEQPALANEFYYRLSNEKKKQYFKGKPEIIEEPNETNE